MDILWLYLLIINALAFILMHTDKKKARHHAWRIPEDILLAVVFVGGSLGAALGMYLLRHKTRKLRFAIGIPLLLALHGALLIFLFLT